MNIDLEEIVQIELTRQAVTYNPAAVHLFMARYLGYVKAAAYFESELAATGDDESEDDE